MNIQMTKFAALAVVLISSFVATEVMAEEAKCGKAELIGAGSTNVNVSGNTCKGDTSRIDVGSAIELAAGGRMWVKFDVNINKGESSQLICQNKSTSSVTVSVASNASPWIKAQGLKNCDKWAGNKLSCDSEAGEKNSFFCAVASAKASSSAAKPDLTTSVKMRGFPEFPKPLTSAEIVKKITPDIGLCKSLYNVSAPLEITWTVSAENNTATDKITVVNVKSENKDLIDCVAGVVKQANASQDTFTHSF